LVRVDLISFSDIFLIEYIYNFTLQQLNLFFEGFFLKFYLSILGCLRIELHYFFQFAFCGIILASWKFFSFSISIFNIGFVENGAL